MKLNPNHWLTPEGAFARGWARNPQRADRRGLESIDVVACADGALSMTLTDGAGQQLYVRLERDVVRSFREEFDDAAANADRRYRKLRESVGAALTKKVPA